MASMAASGAAIKVVPVSMAVEGWLEPDWKSEMSTKYTVDLR